VNDAPVAGLPVKLTAIDVNSGAHLITQGALLANASDVDSASLTAANLQIAAGKGTLVDNHNGTWTYTPAVNDDTAVSFSFTVSDGALSVPASATLDITPAQAAPEIGSQNNDTFTAAAGNSFYEGLGGVDTIIFDFKLTDAKVTYSGNQIIIDGPTSHTIVTGMEKYVFTDGTVNNNDDNSLVDDLFYYANRPDVWKAHIDADEHFSQFGWKEGSDPNAFFDTSFYLALHSDVKVAGTNPLTHFDQSGWKSGAVPSLNFDTAAYLAAYPDVKAAGVDPLQHFLQSGAQEGRQR